MKRTSFRVLIGLNSADEGVNLKEGEFHYRKIKDIIGALIKVYGRELRSIYFLGRKV